MKTEIERHGNFTIYTIDNYVVSEEIFYIVCKHIQEKADASS